MTLREWLDARHPAPPPVLAVRLHALLGERATASASEASDACLAAGEALLARLLREGCVARDTALDLLAADALVTYAFEAAAADPATLQERAERAMGRIASIADVAGA